MRGPFFPLDEAENHDWLLAGWRRDVCCARAGGRLTGGHGVSKTLSLSVTPIHHHHQHHHHQHLDSLQAPGSNNLVYSWFIKLDGVVGWGGAVCEPNISDKLDRSCQIISLLATYLVQC